MIQKKNDTFWWGSYNLVKHNIKFEEANLDTVLKALAALFVLTIRLNESASILICYGYIQSTETSVIQLKRKGVKQTGFIASSRLFLNPDPLPKGGIICEWNYR